MPLVSILRGLSRHRLLVAMGLAFALPIGILTSFSFKDGKLASRQYETGIASAAILVDSTESQVVDTRPGVAELSVRARLLANLMAISPLKDKIASRAGVRADWLIGRPPAAPPAGADGTADAGVTDQTPDSSASIAADDPRASVLSLRVNETLPIITADVHAPDAPAAARIASASIVELERYLTTVSGGNSVPEARKIVVSPLGAATSATETQGRGPFLGVVAFFVVFALWCAFIVMAPGLVRAWREGEPGAADGPVREPQPPSAPPDHPVAEPAPMLEATRADAPLWPEAPPHGGDTESPPPRSTAPPLPVMSGDGALGELGERMERAHRAV